MKVFHWKQLMHPAALTALVGITLLSACSREEQPIAGPVVRPAPSLRLGLEVSSLTASPGQRISVAIANRSEVALGGLQGRLTFDPSALRFLGQDLDPAAATILNDAAAAEGVLTVLTLNARGAALAARTAVLTFEVRSVNYVPTLRYQLAKAVGVDETILRRAQVDGLTEARDLAVSETAARQSDEAWLRAIGGRAGGTVMGVPGAQVSGLVYGDCNESGGMPDVGDVLCIARVAANLSQPISGTNAPAKDAVLAGNVAPANLPGLGEGTDPTPPGVDAGSGGSATDLSSRVIDVSDALAVARCAANIAGVCPNGATPAPPYTGVVNQVIPGREAGQFSRTDSTINCPVTSNLHLGRGKRYLFAKTSPVATTVCNIGSDAAPAVVLTIDAGALMVMDSATLVIGRNAQIAANGTVAEPILMTCAAGQPAPLGTGTVTKGCWGGLYINGNAPINNGTNDSPAISGRSGGGAKQAIGEGASGSYGGDNATDNSGTLRFVVIEGAGLRITATNERNGLTLQGVGSGTTIDYIMSTNGLDDGIEFFGGTVNVKHAYVENTEDDSFDWVAGYRGKLQFGITRGCGNGCDNGIEADNFGIDGGALDPESTPRSAPTFYNMTLLGANISSPFPTTGSNHGILLRMNTAGTIRNVLAFGYRTAGFDIDSTGQATTPTLTTFGLICQRLGGAGNGQTPIGDDALSLRYGYFGQNKVDGDDDAGDPGHLAGTGGATYNCGGYGHTGANLEAAYMAVASNNLFTGQGAAGSFLVDPWGAVPDFRLSGTAPGGFICATPPNDGFFDTSATYCGAVPPQNTGLVNLPWYSGWTQPRTP